MSRKQNALPPHGRNGRRPRRHHRKTRYLVVAGGAVTERQYFEYLAGVYDIVIDYRQKNLDPAQLADYAVDLWKKDAAASDEIETYAHAWVVVDVDQFSHFQRADTTLKRESDIDLVISNPCFEVWLLDHVEIVPVSFVRTNDVEKRAQSKHITEGERSKYINFEKIRGHLDIALRNAARHGSQFISPRWSTENAPWTDMPEIIHYLDKQHGDRRAV